MAGWSMPPRHPVPLGLGLAPPVVTVPSLQHPVEKSRERCLHPPETGGTRWTSWMAGGQQKEDFIFSFEAFSWLSSPKASWGRRRPRHHGRPQSCSEKARKGSENMNRGAVPFPCNYFSMPCVLPHPVWRLGAICCSLCPPLS